jgi:hypothetical protein
MDAAKRDLHLLQIKEQIKKSDQFLLKKRDELEKKYKLNEYLEDIKNEYVSFSEEIKNEKLQQLEALNLIKNYLVELIAMEKEGKEQLRTAKHELNDVLHEINKIKNE